MEHRRFHYFMKRTRDRNWSIGYHTHDVYEIVYYISGKGVTIANNEEYTYSDRTFLLIPPGVPHREIAFCDTELCCLAFQISEDDEICPTLTLQTDSKETLLLILNEIESELKYREPRYEDMLELLVTQAMIRVSRIIGRNQPQDPKKTNDVMASTLSYICNYYYTDINLPQLAQSIGYSYDRFRHMFKECYGYSPKQFILWQRIAQAQVLLRQSNKTVSEIAKQVGFCTVGQLNENFLKFIGMTPSEYKKKFRV